MSGALNFERFSAGSVITSPWSCIEEPGVRLLWKATLTATIKALPVPVYSKYQALCLERASATGRGENSLTVELAEVARSVRVTVFEPPFAVTRNCVDFRSSKPGQFPNPLIQADATFTVLDHDGHVVPHTSIDKIGTTTGPSQGLETSFTVRIELPNEANEVELTVTPLSSIVKATSFNAQNQMVSSDSVTVQGHVTRTILLPGPNIRYVVLDVPNGEGSLQQVCFASGSTSFNQVRATASDTLGQSAGPFFPVDGIITVEMKRLRQVVLTSPREFCVVGVCATLPPGKKLLDEYEKMAQHQRDELARWGQQGDVLAPYSDYRIKIVTRIETTDNTIGNYDLTEFAYFRTQGPPGSVQITVPGPTPSESRTSLETLDRYVRQTVPRTVSALGEKPLLPRPVYRAYDIGVEFNENYVDLMYRMNHRDLGVYLYTNNNRPVVDSMGRLVVLSNRWGAAENLTLSETDKTCITVFNRNNCAPLNTTVIPHDRTLTAGQTGQLLDPDTPYEARLVPLLLHEDFAAEPVGASATGPAESLGRWKMFDQDQSGGPSRWEIRESGAPPSRFVVQTTEIGGGTDLATDVIKPGTLLLLTDLAGLPMSDPDQPQKWTDYRLSAYLRSDSTGAIGLVLRYVDANNHYRFSMDRERAYRRVVRVTNGIYTLLAEDQFVYRRNQDYLITIEAIGSSLRVQQDSEPVFAIEDGTLSSGRIGMYCWRAPSARWSDVRVDDYRGKAPVPYRFRFVTSAYANFFHHLHTFDDETRTIDLPPSASISTLLGQAVSPQSNMAESEAQVYETLAALTEGAEARTNPERVRVTRVSQAGAPFAFLVESREPMDWNRSTIKLQYAPKRIVRPTQPRLVKITNATFSLGQPNDESIVLLLRDSTDLTGWRVQNRVIPGPLTLSGSDGSVVFEDDFRHRESGLLFNERFGANALDRYAIFDEDTTSGSSTWLARTDGIRQSSNVGGSIVGSDAKKPGTYALTGSAEWSDVAIYVTLRSEVLGGIGVAFRFKDVNNYYRFSMDSKTNFRRLIKVQAGTVIVLWEDTTTGFVVNQDYRVWILVFHSQIIVFLDDQLLCDIIDSGIATGRVGLYCWANPGAYYGALTVESLETIPVVYRPVFTDPSGLEILSDTSAADGPGRWSATAGTLRQNIAIGSTDSSPNKVGTLAIAGDALWDDLYITAQLRSGSGGALGIVFRYRDPDNYYRFSIDHTEGRRLIKRVNGIVSVLWEDPLPYALNTAYRLSIVARGNKLSASIDGKPLFYLFDDSMLLTGRIAFYSWNNDDSQFSGVIVLDGTRQVGGWRIRDSGRTGGPSIWELGGGRLRQTSSIGSGNPPGAPGTVAIAPMLSIADARVTARFRPDGDGAVGVMLRYVDDRNHYRFSMSSSPKYRRLIRVAEGLTTVLWEDTVGYDVGSNVDLTVELNGNRIAGFLRDLPLFAIQDVGIGSGRVGVYTWGPAKAQFERVEVRELTFASRALFRDRFVEGDASAWRVVDAGTKAGPSHWVVSGGRYRQTSGIFSPPVDRDTLSKAGTLALTGDVNWRDYTFRSRVQSMDTGAVGVVFRYARPDHFYRFSIDSRRQYRRLVKNVGGVYSLLWQDAVAYTPGVPYEVVIQVEGTTIRGYLDGVTLFVLDDSDIATGGVGVYTWGNKDASFWDVQVSPLPKSPSQHLIDDPMLTNVAGRWTFVDQGDQDGPSRWEVRDNWMRQTTSIHDGLVDPFKSGDGDLEKRGTFAVAGLPSWSDYRVSVQLSSDTDQAIGLMFRVRDNDNYYRFSMDRQRRYRRLIKEVGGVATVLWEDNAEYTTGTSYFLTIDCLGPRVAGYLNGESLFNLEDISISSGRIALYCWNNVGARFNELLVTAPAWVEYYSFGNEARSVVGSRIQIFSGHAADASPSEVGVSKRFRATFDERGERQFRDGIAHLRLVTPDGGASHERMFLSEASYAEEVNLRVLRKRDGTGFFALVPSAAPMSSLKFGQYRIQLTYHRDNRVHDPLSQVLTEAGNREPETVNLDVPWSDEI